MSEDNAELDRLQDAYRSALEKWIAAIRQEEALVALADHSLAEVDKWEQAHFAEDEVRGQVKSAKRDYEDALRRKFFNF